ncbi:MAG: type I methionyl aminopeptidase [Patescibacteria group bacterium]|jgi:methionyl aminopeptidase
MITIKKKDEINKLREGGKILSLVLDDLQKMAKPGVNLLDLEKRAEKLIKAMGAEPSFKGYSGYPAILCTSVNEEVVHCAPKNRKLKEGDIISIDCGVKYKNLFTDSARTVPVGKISEPARKLMHVTATALHIAMHQVREGNTVGDIGAAIENYVSSHKLSVVRSLVGHGVGYKVHEDPKIPNYGKPKEGAILRAGMVICIEPMVNIGGSEVVFEDDGWTVTTKDYSLSAHFEHTILVKENGAEILTK